MLARTLTVVAIGLTLGACTTDPRPVHPHAYGKHGAAHPGHKKDHIEMYKHRGKHHSGHKKRHGRRANCHYHDDKHHCH